MTKSSTSVSPLGSITHDKIVSSRAVSYRLAKKPDGTLTLQGAFKWYRGNTGTSATTELSDGIEWIDIPTVEVDE